MPIPPAKRQPVSLADVARAAGTSTAVVSYVVNDGPRRVAEATRQRVLDEIERLGYRPNRIARALRSSRSNTLGLLVPDITNAFFADLSHTFETAAFAKGYLTFVGNAAFDPAREEPYLQAFVDLQVDGMAVVAVAGETEGSDSFEEIQAPIVFIHHKGAGLPGDIVRFDDQSAGEIAANVLAAQRIDHVVEIAGPLVPGPVGVRTEAFESAFDRSQVPGSFHRIEAQFNRQDASRVFEQFLSDHPGLRNIGVFAPTDEQALGVLHAAARAGLLVPDDIVIIGGEGTTAGRYAAPALSSIDVPTEVMAVTALDLLLAKMRDPDAPGVARTLEISYTDRGTTRPRRN